MKRLLLPLLAALVLPTAVEANWFGKYGSFKEAEKACGEWARRKGSATYITYENFDTYKNEGYWFTDFGPLRKCIHEEITSEILGFEFLKMKDIRYKDEKWRSTNYPFEIKKLKKRFEYDKNIPKADSDLKRIYNQEENKKYSDNSFCKRLIQRAQFSAFDRYNTLVYGRYLINSEGKVYYVGVNCGFKFRGVIGKDTMIFSCPSFRKTKLRANQVRWEIKGGKLVKFSRWKICDEIGWRDVEKFTYYQLD